MIKQTNRLDIEISSKGIRKLLQNLNPLKAAGLDNIPCQMLKLVAQEIAPALTLLFRSPSTLEKSSLPENTPSSNQRLKKREKKGVLSSPSNYQTISLTLVCGKLLEVEHIVSTGIASHFDHNNILIDTQHGFHK